MLCFWAIFVSELEEKLYPVLLEKKLKFYALMQTTDKN